MIALLTLLVLFALGAAVDAALTAARRAITCRAARRASTTWRACRVTIRYPHT